MFIGYFTNVQTYEKKLNLCYNGLKKASEYGFRCFTHAFVIFVLSHPFFRPPQIQYCL